MATQGAQGPGSALPAHTDVGTMRDGLALKKTEKVFTSRAGPSRIVPTSVCAGRAEPGPCAPCVSMATQRLQT